MGYLPNLVTLMNLCFGTMALLSMFAGDYHRSAVYILIAVLLDGLDGRLARRLNTTSELGKQMDSLSDLVSFGVAPAILIFACALEPAYGYGVLPVTVTLLFVVCGAYRLARFNVLNISDYFVGIPITAAGGLLGALSFLEPVVPALAFLVLVPLLSFLMVSTVKVPKL